MNQLPTSQQPLTSPGQRLLVVATSAASAAGGAALLLLRDPNTPGSFGTCPTLHAFGVYCPGCGSLRGLHALLTGHPREAAGLNLLLLPALAWLTWWWTAQAAAAAGRRITGPPTSARFCYALLAVIAVFTILRNVPGSPLAP